MTQGSQSHAADRERARQIAGVFWLTLGLNWIVAAFKLVLGWFTGSLMIMADGFHSLSDGTNNIIGIIAIQIAGSPADREHPYGHRKFETLASMVIAVFLALVSLGILRQAILGFIHPKEPVISKLSFIVMGVTLAVNIFVAWYERKRGEELHSELLTSDAWHTLSDVLVTLSIFAGLIGVRLGFHYLDPIFALFISGIIMLTALHIGRKGAEVLVDRAPVDIESVERVVRTVAGVKDCHRIRARGRADFVHVDMHVLVDPAMTVAASHRLTNIIERDIRKAIVGVRDVVVHIEPVTHDHTELDGLGEEHED